MAEMTFEQAALAAQQVSEGASDNSMTFEEAIELATGKSVEAIRSTPLDELRSDYEREIGAPLSFVSEFPLLGRGNVLRDRCLSHAQIEADLDDALRETEASADV